jgi:hypothetical protein
MNLQIVMVIKETNKISTQMRRIWSVDWDIFCSTGELMKKKDSIMALCTTYGKMLKWQTV